MENKNLEYRKEYAAKAEEAQRVSKEMAELGAERKSRRLALAEKHKYEGRELADRQRAENTALENEYAGRLAELNSRLMQLKKERRELDIRIRETDTAAM